jgi:sugar (pentulose or hexulose) kinase
VAAAALYVGLDLGTSGARAVAIDGKGAVVASASCAMPAPLEAEDGTRSQDPALWREAAFGVLAEIVSSCGGEIRALAVDGTSGTLLLCDATGRPLGPARMYNDASAAPLAARIRALAPPESGAHGATSPLARLLVLQADHPAARHALHQADWLAGQLTGRFGRSDDNNALKLGWDPVHRVWPDWLDRLGARRELLPEVVPPGTVLGPLAPTAAAEIGLGLGCLVVAGTTDGCASFLATGATERGDGVTALGSTLTIKLLSAQPIFAPEYGVYSHRLGDHWLAGGAANTGGAALLRFFTAERIAELTPALRPETPTGLDWHPLPGRGERFPIADPDLTFEPGRPDDDATFLQGLLEGIAAVEARAYALLEALGGPALRSVRTVGGGARNPAWSRIRRARLGVPLLRPSSLEAAYGAALLAWRAVGPGRGAGDG